MTFDAVDQLAVNTVRTLSMDAIQAANSGHPGLPMGAAPMAYVLWKQAVTGQTETVLFFLQDMDLQCYTAYYI